MKNFIITAFLAVLFLYTQKSMATENTFHAPQSPAEKTLAHILELDSQKNSNIYPFLTKTFGFYPNIKYERLFTKKFIDAIAKNEERLVQENCDGEYTKGQACGIDINPLTCSQDAPDYYLYKTIKETDQEAFIVFIWPQDINDTKLNIPHRMKKENGVWKLDGINCFEGYRFNY